MDARMDVGRITNVAGDGINPVPGVWSCNFHALDPIRVANGLGYAVEILPNNLFVAGTRFEYTVKTCYAGGLDTFYHDDYNDPTDVENFEILPMMRDDGLGAAEWPCLIVADHFGTRGNWFERNSRRIRRHLDALGYDYDLYSKLAPSSGMMNGIARWAQNPGQVGGPGTDKWNWGSGLTLEQCVGYTYMILNTGDIYGEGIVEQDTDMLTSWLVLHTTDLLPRHLYVSGNQAARCLNAGVGWGTTFLTTVLCATMIPSPGHAYHLLTGDMTYCLPIQGIAGGAITCAPLGDPETFVIRQNACSRQLNVLGVSGAAGCGALAELEFAPLGPGGVDIAAVSNVISVAGGANYMSLIDGMDFCLIRDGTGGIWNCTAVDPGDGPLTSWLDCVLTGWMGYDKFTPCGPFMVVDVGDPGSFAPAVVTSLGQAYPNPMNPTATIKFSIGTSGKVSLRIFDVSGRVIRTLVDDVRDANEYSVTWDGKSDRGDRVASGVFFYQLDAPGFRSAKKIVILQ
jgi:hypothetical protein